MIKAAIDIGSNSTRLLVAKISGPSKTDLYRQARITRLSQGVDKTRLLSPDATKRTINVLADYKIIAENLGATEFIIGATSAARDAKNINDFLNAVKQKTGLTVQILSSEEEATLSFMGAIQIFSLLPSTTYHLPALVIDIGGGSTEISIGQNINQKPELFFSKDVGSVRLTEMFITNDPPTDSELKQATDYITQIFQQPVEEITTLYSDFLLIGTAGTITTVSAINLKLEKYDPQVVHRSTLKTSSVNTILNRLKRLAVDERAKIKAIQPGREDVIVMGTLILLTLLKMFSAKELIVSETDILDGLMLP